MGWFHRVSILTLLAAAACNSSGLSLLDEVVDTGEKPAGFDTDDWQPTSGDADVDADSDSDSDADADTDSDTDTDTGGPPTPTYSAPVLTGLWTTVNGNDVTVNFTVTDADNDLTPGNFRMYVDGLYTDYPTPGGLSWNPSGTSSVSQTLAGGSGCTGSTHTIAGEVRDSRGLVSNNLTDTVTLGGSGVTSGAMPETGDGWPASAWNPGSLARGAVISGSLYGTGFDTWNSVYTSDLDFIELHVCQSGNYSIVLNWTPSADNDLALFDSLGYFIDYAEGSSYSGPEVVSSYLDANSTYYVRVVGYAGSAGAWTVTLN